MKKSNIMPTNPPVIDLTAPEEPIMSASSTTWKPIIQMPQSQLSQFLKALGAKPVKIVLPQTPGANQAKYKVVQLANQQVPKSTVSQVSSAPINKIVQQSIAVLPRFQLVSKSTVPQVNSTVSNNVLLQTSTSASNLHLASKCTVPQVTSTVINKNEQQTKPSASVSKISVKASDSASDVIKIEDEDPLDISFTSQYPIGKNLSVVANQLQLKPMNVTTNSTPQFILKTVQNPIAQKSITSGIVKTESNDLIKVTKIAVEPAFKETNSTKSQPVNKNILKPTIFKTGIIQQSKERPVQNTPQTYTKNVSTHQTVLNEVVARNNVDFVRPASTVPQQAETITLEIVRSDSDDETIDDESGPCRHPKCLRFTDPKNADIDEPILENPDLLFLKRLLEIPEPTEEALANIHLTTDEKYEADIKPKNKRKRTGNNSDTGSESSGSEDDLNKSKKAYMNQYVMPLRKNFALKNVSRRHLEQKEYAPVGFSMLREFMEKKMNEIRHSEIVLEEVIEKREKIEDKINELKMEQNVLEQKRQIILRRKKRQEEKIENTKQADTSVSTKNVCVDSASNSQTGNMDTEENTIINNIVKEAQNLTREQDDLNDEDIDLFFESQKAIELLTNEMEDQD